jgi:hypothetical protein
MIALAGWRLIPARAKWPAPTRGPARPAPVWSERRDAPPFLPHHHAAYCLFLVAVLLRGAGARSPRRIGVEEYADARAFALGTGSLDQTIWLTERQTGALQVERKTPDLPVSALIREMIEARYHLGHERIEPGRPYRTPEARRDAPAEPARSASERQR